MSRRESHDSSGFYARFEPPVFSDHDGVGEPKSVDEVFLGDSRDMADVADDSVALVVTSPPYFAGKAYEEALGEGHIPASYLDYLQMLTDVFAECVRTLEPGGRIAVNVANLGRRPYRSLSADVVTILQDRLGLLAARRDRVAEGPRRGRVVRLGLVREPSNPVLRDVTERVVVGVEGPPRSGSHRQAASARGPAARADDRGRRLHGGHPRRVGDGRRERVGRVGHPAPFPVELPQRLIELHTYEGDLVLDPFMGSGSAPASPPSAPVVTSSATTPTPTTSALAEARVADETARVASDGLARLPREKAVDVARRLARRRRVA